MSNSDSDQPRTEGRTGKADSPPSSSGQMRPYQLGYPVPPAGAGLPASLTTQRPPIELVARPIPAYPSSPFVAFWSRPATIISVLLLILLMAIMTTWALARSSLPTAPGAAGPTSASPSPSSSPSATPSISVDQSLEPPTPETQPSGAATGPGPSSAPTAGGVEPAGDPFALSDVEPFSSGSATLSISDDEQLDLEDWNRTGSDIQFTRTGIVGRDGNQLALLQAGEARSFSACQAKTAWASALNWNQVSAGTYTCVKWGTRRGLMRIDYPPDLNERYPEVTVTGVIWAPAVKG
ncbi:hypothetical protein [Micromonospora haikouensis]|uniref:hypothetical protein n=1 Tax=Micromonospora haikouensis TaxID=686309 RepID=UPI0037B9626B